MQHSDQRNSLEQNYIRLLFHTRNKIRFAMDEKLKPMGITDATWRALFFIRQAGSGVHQKDLARNMSIEGPSLVRLLDHLEGRDLIERRTDPKDRRSKTIHLTPQSAPLMERLDECAREVRGEMMAEISDEDLHHSLTLLENILAKV